MNMESFRRQLREIVDAERIPTMGTWPVAHKNNAPRVEIDVVMREPQGLFMAQAGIDHLRRSRNQASH
jgi:hypothetical protein